MHETERKSKIKSCIFLVLALSVFLLGAIPMICAWTKTSASMSVLAPFKLMLFLYFFMFSIYFSIILSAIAFKFATVALRECMHDSPCRSSKRLKTVTLIILILLSTIGLTFLMPMIGHLFTKGRI